MRSIIKKLGTLIGARRTLNFIEGSNVTMTIADNPTENRVDITIASAGGSGSPGGSNTQVQFNDGGSFGGDADMTYDKTTNVLSVPNITTQIIKANSSAGGALQGSSGSDCMEFGAGGGQNVTFLDGVKLDASTASRILSTDASKNILALDTTTYPSLTELSYLKGVTSSIQTQINGKAASSHTHTASNITDFNTSVDARIALQQDENDILAYKALGSTVVAQTVGFPLQYCNTSSNLTDNQIRWVAVYLKEAATVTGIRVYMRVAGNYTGDNTNGAALYTYSGGTLTQVAVSSNTSSLWTAAANAHLNIPFTPSTYSASAGLYFVAILYNNSAQTTAPAVATGTALNNAAMGGTAWGFTNSAKLYGTSNSNTLPASIAMSSITASTATTWVALY